MNEEILRFRELLESVCRTQLAGISERNVELIYPDLKGALIARAGEATADNCK
jgi:hypothetical protein